MSDENPYVLTEATIEEPPKTFLGSMKYLGPGFILSASIVGSGELIATTALGAKAGFVLLWVILVSCLVKVTLQLEFGKHAISHGETTMAAFNQLPGPKWGPGNWSIWAWLALMVLKFLQVGGIIGLVGVIANIAFPGIVPVWVWTLFFAAVVSLMIFRGYYRPIEKISLVLIGLFTVLTLLAVFSIQKTAFEFTWADIRSGLVFELPRDTAMLLVAAAAFGITGVGGDEIMHYVYWLLEKGYAAKTGPRDGSEAWTRRAKGWIRVMYIDALLAMVVYTVMTAAFYILGAAVLNAGGGLPDGPELVPTLATMYTQTLGPWAGKVFLLGAFVVLFSTLFAALGAWTRAFADSFGQLKWIDFYDPASRRRAIGWLAWVIPLLWAASYFFMGAPKLMVIIGGAATTAMLVLVVVAACHFRFKRLPMELKPGLAYSAAFYISVVAIGIVAIYSVVKPFLPAAD